MNNYIKIGVVLVLVCIAAPVHAGESDAWEFRFFGINHKDFKDRCVLEAIGGAVVSFLSHEAGHYFFGTVAGIKFDGFSNLAVDPNDNSYRAASGDRRLLYHAGGFIAQVLVGGVLTAIPNTRHTDFTVGFNAFTGVNSMAYGITGGRDDSTSDVVAIDRYWNDNGKATAFVTSACGFGLTYINLNKEKE